MSTDWGKVSRYFGDETSQFWTDNEIHLTIEHYLDLYNGCVHCGCDHGCNQWILEQGPRIGLIMEKMFNGATREELDKLVQIPNEDIVKQWLRWRHDLAEHFNELLQKNMKNIPETIKEYHKRKKT